MLPVEDSDADRLEIGGSWRETRLLVVIIVAVLLLVVGTVISVDKFGRESAGSGDISHGPSATASLPHSAPSSISLIAEQDFNLDSLGDGADVSYSFSLVNQTNSVVTVHAPSPGPILPGLALRPPRSNSGEANIEPYGRIFLTLYLHIESCRLIPTAEQKLLLQVDENGAQTTVPLDPPGRGQEAWQRTVAAQYCKF